MPVAHKNGATAVAPKPLLLSAVVPFPESGDFVGVQVLYDLSACLGFNERAMALLGDLLKEDRRLGREIQRARVEFRQAYPSGAPTLAMAGDAPTPAEWAAYEAAQDAFDADQEAMQQHLVDLATARTANARAIALRTIAVCVVGVTGPDDWDPPRPTEPADWAAWPDLALEWLANEGKTAAEAELTGKKWKPSSTTPSTQP